MTPVTALDPRVQDLVRDAAWWRLLSRLFECPDTTWRTDIERLATELGDPGLDAAVDAALTEATEGQYHSVFGPGGPAPPREVSYHDTLELGSVMSSLAAYYGAFGYEPATRETPDHVAVETGFIAFLRLKEAFALASANPDAAAIAADAAERFRSDHLAMIAGRIAGLLADAPLEYLQKASALLASRVGPKRGPKPLPMVHASSDDEECEFSCGDN
jgi:nitrate reductase assembly molybdenum cofactor insertion protein NarJ